MQIDFDGESFIFNVEKVELIPEDQLKKQAIKNFFCENCGNHFMTLVLKNATTICSKCASTKVQEVIESPKPEAEKDKHADSNGNGKSESPINPQVDGTHKTQTNFPGTHA